MLLLNSVTDVGAEYPLQGYGVAPDYCNGRAFASAISRRFHTNKAQPQHDHMLIRGEQRMYAMRVGVVSHHEDIFQIASRLIWHSRFTACTSEQVIVLQVLVVTQFDEILICV